MRLGRNTIAKLALVAAQAEANHRLCGVGNGYPKQDFPRLANGLSPSGAMAQPNPVLGLVPSLPDQREAITPAPPDRRRVLRDNFHPGRMHHRPTSRKIGYSGANEAGKFIRMTEIIDARPESCFFSVKPAGRFAKCRYRR